MSFRQLSLQNMIWCEEYSRISIKIKHDKYSELKANNYIFNAFAIKTFGCWSNDALNLIKEIGPRLNKIIGDPGGDPRSHEYLVQRILMAIHRANVSSIMGTLPSTTRVDQVFYLQ